MTSRLPDRRFGIALSVDHTVPDSVSLSGADVFMAIDEFSNLGYFEKNMGLFLDGKNQRREIFVHIR